MASHTSADAIRERAARWVARLNDHDLSDAEREDLQGWLLADPRHSTEFRAHNASSVWPGISLRTFRRASARSRRQCLKGLTGTRALGMAGRSGRSCSVDMMVTGWAGSASRHAAIAKCVRDKNWRESAPSASRTAASATSTRARGLSDSARRASVLSICAAPASACSMLYTIRRGHFESCWDTAKYRCLGTFQRISQTEWRRHRDRGRRQDCSEGARVRSTRPVWERKLTASRDYVSTSWTIADVHTCSAAQRPAVAPERVRDR